jgi:hypothetical protein
MSLGSTQMENITNNWKGALAAVGLMLGVMAPLDVAVAESGSIVVPPHATAYGSKFSEWSAQWWQLMLSIPTSENPLFDSDGSQCVLGQRGPVWFLVGWFGPGAATRACAIPEGKALFFPVINVVDVNVAAQTATELRAETAPCLDAVTLLSVVVDGVSVPKLDENFRVRSEVFEVTLPVDNLFGIDPGTYSPTIDDGFYVMLKPLSVGTHTVHFVGASGGCPLLPFAFGADVTYNLTVVPVSLE